MYIDCTLQNTNGRLPPQAANKTLQVVGKELKVFPRIFVVSVVEVINKMNIS